MSAQASTNSPISHLCGIAVPSKDTKKKSKELALSEAISHQDQGNIGRAVLAAQSQLWDNGEVCKYLFGFLYLLTSMEGVGLLVFWWYP